MATCAGACQTLRNRQIEQQGEIGFDQRRPVLEFGDARPRLAATAALVRIARIGESIRQHPAPGRKRGLDDLTHELRARGEHQQKLAFRHDALPRRVEHDRAHRFAECGAAGFARHHHVQTAGGQPLAHGFERGALAGALAAFQGDQFSTHAIPDHGVRCN